MAMKAGIRGLKRWAIEIAVAICAIHLGWLMYAGASSPVGGEMPCQRNKDFPRTFISRIHLDLTSPNSLVTLTWCGPNAATQDAGPFHSSPGAGWGTNNCNDSVESNCPNSMCTPKGTRKVEGFMDHLKDGEEFRYVTLIDRERSIGFHAHPSVPPYPASKGCVRLEPHAARLIYDNAIAGKTEIVIGGTWTNPNTVVGDAKQGS
ncbi:MAG TPA: L,D-transpeptidase [Lacipirellulaceae bacterium]|nr:L,D-transpeptidase [Lacipirellulaceae bacterium]